MDTWAGAKSLRAAAARKYNCPTMTRLLRGVWLLAIAAAAGGCAPAAIYTATEGGYAGIKITPKSTWSVRGSLPAPRAAIDGELATIARSDYDYTGAELIIDLKQPCMFQTVVIEHGGEDRGFCRRVAVATSLEGKLWLIRHTAPGTRRVTLVSLPQVVLARYVRLRVLQPGSRPWAVAEVFLQ
jgi:hypothetical protein